MNNLRDIVNGAQLRGFMNKQVSITGKVNEVDPNGNFFYINSTDDIKVKIKVSQPITNQLSGWIVVRIIQLIFFHMTYHSQFSNSTAVMVNIFLF